MKIAGHDQVFFKGPRRGNDLSSAVHCKTGPVEHQLIVAAHLVHIHDRFRIALRRRAIDSSPHLALAHVERRRVDADHDFRARAEQLLHRIARIEAMLPVALVVPGVLADRQRHGLASQGEQVFAFARAEVASLIEHIVIRQQHFTLPEYDLAAFQHRGAVQRTLAGFGLRSRHIPADDAEIEVRRFASQPFQFALTGFEKTRLLHQIARRVAGERKLGKHHCFGAAAGRVARGPRHPVHVTREIPNRGIDLRQSDAHLNLIL